MEWISVEDRLPLVGERVIVMRDKRTSVEAWRIGHMDWWTQGVGPVFRVSHWAPLPPEEPEPDGWISVEDRLPAEEGVAVLVGWAGAPFAAVAYQAKGKWRTEWDNELFQMHDPPTHWQPLPEPPEPAESPPAFFMGAPREDSTYRGVYHITGRWVEGFSDEGEAIRLRDRLNKLWEQDKGSTKETP